MSDRQKTGPKPAICTEIEQFCAEAGTLSARGDCTKALEYAQSARDLAATLTGNSKIRYEAYTITVVICVLHRAGKALECRAVLAELQRLLNDVQDKSELKVLQEITEAAREVEAQLSPA